MASIKSSFSVIFFTEPSARTMLHWVMYSDNSFPLVPCVPVANAPPIVIVFMSGKQGIHHPLASIISSNSLKMRPDCTVIVWAESSKDKILL